MWQTISDFFGYCVFFYSIILMASYLYLIISSAGIQEVDSLMTPDPNVIRHMLKNAPFLPGVSVIAPAYNEEKTIIDNVNCLLSIDYPKFEVIIINDGSSDRTMELMITEFEMHEVPFVYHEYVKCKPVKTIYRSDNPKYKNLVLVDKERAGYKCDGSNAGINVSSYEYFVCTDVDCIVNPLALYRMIWPVINHHKKVVGVSATMLISNGCKVKNGQLIERRVPRNVYAMFQSLEYLRSFLVGKLGWSRTNILPNISGGFGFYDKRVVIEAGGYGAASLAEDMDMLLKMVRYQCDTDQEYTLVQVPDALCWTEGPSSLKSLYKQRTRWAKGLCQIMGDYLKMAFRTRYRGIGMLIMPYEFIFEFMAPIIEGIGALMFVWLLVSGSINWDTFWLISLMIYCAALLTTIVVILFDYNLSSAKWKNPAKGYRRLFLAGALEPILYHPIITYCSIVGYIQFIFKINMGWGVMQSTGFQDQKKTIVKM